MFDFLKKKISGFIDGITRKEEEKAAKEEPQEKPAEEEKPAEKVHAPKKAEAPKKPPAAEEKTIPGKAEKPVAPKQENARAPADKAAIAPRPEPRPSPKAAEPPPKKGIAEQKPQIVPVKEKRPEPVREARQAKPAASAPQQPAAPARPATEKPAPESMRPSQPHHKAAPKPETREPVKEAPAPEPAHAEEKEEPEPEAVPAPLPEPPRAKEPEKPKERLKLGIMGTVKSIITREVEIGEKDVKDMVESLELELLEADVELSVAESIKEELMGRLVGSRVPRKDLHAHISGRIRETLIGMLTNERDFDILERIESCEKPLRIMFIGINGAGKTTTIAKVAKLLMDNNRKVVFAAADTFRAAAIEQMGAHAERLGVKMIKREYGSDPTSVAYDAVNYARAHGIDAVLIDTAGRQDTNISLLNEMKKMKRVINPDITVYIGESIAGNAILEQVSAFNREIGVDAVILSKLDCDPKGGTMLSISRATGVPIIYVGIGQGYDALERFDPVAIVSRIVE